MEKGDPFGKPSGRFFRGIGSWTTPGFRTLRGLSETCDAWIMVELTPRWAWTYTRRQEEQRAAREGLDAEELAIFDLLTKPEPKLTKAQEVAVKRIARALLAKLKREKLILDWRLKENAKADVRQTIREEYDDLPEVYDRRLWEEKVERTFQFMFERYPGEIPAPPA
jgi:hypothetical protein